ncbi:hypothetical protein ACFOHS_14540 [Jhaorihella thermophila]
MAKSRSKTLREFLSTKVLSFAQTPYYDNVGYADLSDFFFVWMKRVLRPIYPELFGVLATPKSEELVATPTAMVEGIWPKHIFLDGMRTAIANMSQQSSTDYPTIIYYAFKQSEVAQDGISSTGWATFCKP